MSDAAHEDVGVQYFARHWLASRRLAEPWAPLDVQTLDAPEVIPAGSMVGGPTFAAEQSVVLRQWR